MVLGAESTALSKYDNDFAVTMFEQLRRQAGNFLFSPFSIQAAAGLAYAGARGETASQMRAALRLSSSHGKHFADIVQRVAVSRGNQYEMVMANSLWTHDGAPIESSFIDLVARSYGATIRSIRLGGGVDSARTAINQWARDATNGRITELVPSGCLTAETRLVLANAIYFKGKWMSEFRTDATRDEPFYLDTGCEVVAPLMHRNGQVAYVKSDGYAAVELPYQGNDLSMLVLLPDDRDGLGELEKKVSVHMLVHADAQMRLEEVDVYLPRFEISRGDVRLRDPLSALGMSLAFDRSQADFSGINGCTPPHEDALFISDIFHSAAVEVNEEGTQARAATLADITHLSVVGEPETFRADHPFLFAIRDRRSGAILFFGRIVDPTRESWEES